MARENSFIFLGEVVNAPVVFLNEEYENYRVTFTLKTLRRNGRTDYPKISVYGLSKETAKDYVGKLKPGVFVMTRGMLSTKMVKKQVKCEACGEINMVDTLQTEVISYSPPYVFREKIVPEEIAEFANVGNLIGSLCVDVSRKDSVNGPTAAQFQIAVNRRYRVNELEKGTRTDYPWVKVFGSTADECFKRLQKSSQVYISGSFQTRDISRHIVCQSCSGKLIYTERVGEVLPNGVEFLNNCLFEPKNPVETAGTEVAVHEEKKP